MTLEDGSMQLQPNFDLMNSSEKLLAQRLPTANCQASESQSQAISIFFYTLLNGTSLLERGENS